MKEVTITPQPSPDFYTAGGTLDPTDSSYIVRAADTELLETVKQGQFCYVLTPRQMGKSSLMVRTAKSLQKIDISSVIIDLSAGGTTNSSAGDWYLGQVLEIAEQLGISGNYAWWWKRHAYLSPVQRFSKFLTQVVIEKTTQPVVIFIDEIDTTLSLRFNSDDYFAAIRALYNKRATDAKLKRLTFVLLGVASPSDLIKDAHRTPFNIGTRIQLTDFTPEEAKPLISGLAPERDLGERLLDQILFLTGGHPYLTQKTCMRVARWAKTEWSPSEASIIVEKLVEEMFFSEAGRNTDDNLQFILKRIVASKEATKLLQFYRRIRRGEVLLDNELDPIPVALKLSGLVKADDAGILIVRNPIYERVFDEFWIREALSEREPQLTGEAELRYDVFISHGSLDRRWVDHYLLPAFEEVGLRTWIDREELRPGQVMSSEIRKAIELSRNMLIILSPSSVASQEVLYESELFLRLASKENERQFIPLLLKPTRIPSPIDRYQWIDFTQEEHWELAMEELLGILVLNAPTLVKRGIHAVSVPKSPTRYNTAAIRALLQEAFEDEDLAAFVYDYFRPVYKQFSISRTKNQEIQLLIEYADEHKLFEQLLDNIARQRPRHYDRFANLLEIKERGGWTAFITPPPSTHPSPPENPSHSP